MSKNKNNLPVVRILTYLSDTIVEFNSSWSL